MADTQDYGVEIMKAGKWIFMIVASVLVFLMFIIIVFCTGVFTMPPQKREPDQQAAIAAAQEKLDAKAEATKALENRIRKDLEDAQKVTEEANKAQKAAIDKGIIDEVDRREKEKAAREKALVDALDKAVEEKLAKREADAKLKALEKKVQQFEKEAKEGEKLKPLSYAGGVVERLQDLAMEKAWLQGELMRWRKNSHTRGDIVRENIDRVSLRLREIRKEENSILYGH